MVMAKVIPQLLRDFEIRLKYPEKDWKVKNVWFVRQSGVECVLTRRQREY
jgi:hypothetical protein